MTIDTELKRYDILICNYPLEVSMYSKKKDNGKLYNTLSDLHNNLVEQGYSVLYCDENNRSNIKQVRCLKYAGIAIHGNTPLFNKGCNCRKYIRNHVTKYTYFEFDNDITFILQKWNDDIYRKREFKIRPNYESVLSTIKFDWACKGSNFEESLYSLLKVFYENKYTYKSNLKKFAKNLKVKNPDNVDNVINQFINVNKNNKNIKKIINSICNYNIIVKLAANMNSFKEKNPSLLTVSCIIYHFNKDFFKYHAIVAEDKLQDDNINYHWDCDCGCNDRYIIKYHDLASFPSLATGKCGGNNIRIISNKKSDFESL